MLLRRYLIPLIAGAVLASPCMAGDAEFAQALHDRFPATVGAKIVPAFAGFYAIINGGDVIYVRDDLSILIAGEVMDLKSNRSLTAKFRQVEVNLSELDPRDGIVIGQGSRRVYVFSDPDCPFCRHLQSALSAVPDLQTVILPFPIAGIHPDSKARAESIWCAKDKEKAWVDYLMRGEAPAPKTCANPIARNIALGQKLHVKGTPSVIFPDGTMVARALSASQIEAMLVEHRAK